MALKIESFSADPPRSSTLPPVFRDEDDSPGSVVTALKPGLKDKDRINIFLDGKFSFSLTFLQLSEANLKIGQKLSPEEINSLKCESNFGKLYQRSLEYALSRPHSEKEIRDYLKRKQQKRKSEQKRYDSFCERLKTSPEYREYVNELRSRTKERNNQLKSKSFEEDNRFEYRGFVKTNLPSKPGAEITDADIERVVKKLIENRAVDDVHFARFFIENRNRAKGTSFKKLKLELRAKGISDDIIEEAFSTDEFGDTLRDEKAEIKKVIEKKLRRNTPREKLIPYLLRQGFPYDLVQDSLREMDSQNSEQNPYA